MQFDLFQAVEQGRRAPGGGEACLEVFSVFDRAEEALREKLKTRGEGISAVGTGQVMLFHELFGVLCDGALRFVGREGLEVWYAGRRKASPVELQMIVRQIVREAYPVDGEGVFAEVSRRGGFVVALLDFFEECREGNASPEVFREFVAWGALQGLDGARLRRMSELAGLLERYEATLARLGLLDEGLGLRVALDALRDPRLPLPGVLRRARVRFLDIYDWSPIRIDVARELARQLAHLGLGAAEDRVEIHLPYDFERPSIFHYLEPVLRQVESMEGESLTLCWQVDDLLVEKQPLEHLAQSVWTSADMSGLGVEAGQIEGLGPSCLKIIEAPGQTREARAVSRRVRSLLAQGAAPDEIVIAPRTLDEGLGEICAALDEYGVPWHCQRGVPLSSAAPARLMMSLLRLVMDNYPREAFIEIIASRYTRGRTEGVEREIARLLREAGVRDDLSASGSGRSAYDERLEATVRRLERRVERGRARRARAENPMPEDAIPVEAHPEVQRVAELCSRILWLRRTIAEHLPMRRRTLADHARGLSALLSILDVEAEARRGAGAAPEYPGRDPVGGRLLKATARDHQALRLLGLLLAEIVRSDPSEVLATIEGDDGLATLGEFYELLGQLLGQMTLRLGGARGGCVRILPIKHLAGCKVPHVVIPGLNQGRFPATLRSRPLFMDEDRLSFGRFEASRRRQLGADEMRMSFPLQCLPYEDDVGGGAPVPARQSEEVLLFSFGISAARETLTLSCSTLDQSGRKSVRSVFLDEVIRRLDPHAVDDVLHREVLDPVPSPEACVAPWEVVSRYQLEAFGDGIKATEPTAALAAVGRNLEGSGVKLSTIAQAAQVERVRHQFSGMPAEQAHAALEAEPLGQYCGEVGEVHGAWLDKVLGFEREAPLTAGMLGDFGTCPQRFFFGRLMHLSEARVATQDVSALDRHTAVKGLLEAAYQALDGSGLLPLGGVDEDVQREALEVALVAMAEAVESLEEVSGRAHPRLWTQAREECEALIEQLIAREQELGPNQQISLPWAFGAPPHGPGRRVGGRPSLALELGAGMVVNISGQIDRVLMGVSLGQEKLELVEYGAGLVANYEKRLDDERRLVTDFSLSLAMLAVAEGLVPKLQSAGLMGQEVMITARYESLLEGGKQTRPLVGEVGGAGLEGDAVEEARGRVAEAVARLRLGSYPFATRDCTWCELRAVCRRGTYPERDR